MTVKCPVCRNRDGTEADGAVIRKYRPHDVGGRIVERLTPLEKGVLRCAYCETVLYTWKGKERGWERHSKVKG